MRLRDLAHKNVVVWGAGVEGIAAATAALTAKASVSLAVDGLAKAPTDAPQIPDAPTYYGETAIQKLLSADVVIKSPGIPPRGPLMLQLAKAGVPVTSSTRLWLADHADRVIGVTGSKGKSTTASLLAHLMNALDFDTALGGNIGIPLLSLPGHHTWYVAELSSFQCADVERSPWGVVYTSLFPDHLDWHGDVEDYYEAKLNLAAHHPNLVFANGTNTELKERLPHTVNPNHIRWTDAGIVSISGDHILFHGQRLLHTTDLPLLGKHNLSNLSLCLLVLDALGVDLPDRVHDIRQALSTFQPLEHRLEVVSRAHNLRWIDDGLSTNAHAAIAALESFEHEQITLIVGGADRGISYEALPAYLRKRLTAITILTTPDNGPRIAATLGKLPRHSVIQCSSLEDAVKRAFAITPAGGIVLLSPAAPSFGLFKNYQDRGRAFREYIAALNVHTK